MKLITLILLIKWFSITTQVARPCFDPIVSFNETIPQTIDFMMEGNGRYFDKIIIVGIPTNQTDQFTINLAEEGELFKTANVPFHFNSRFNEKIIARNRWTKEKGWEKEESSGGFPFAVGQPFILEFYATVYSFHQIMIYVNDKFFASYIRGTLSFDKITQLQINGAIKLSSIAICGISQLPPPPICEDLIIFSDVNVRVNYDFEKIKFGLGFQPKKKIIITGTPLAETKDFVINIGESGVMEKNATIVFSFSPRFDEKVVVRNTWTKEKGWGFEENGGGFPFAVGQSFILEIFIDFNIHVKLNYKPYIQFYHFDDLTKVSQIEISRAIKVSSVVFCKKYN